MRALLAGDPASCDISGLPRWVKPRSAAGSRVTAMREILKTNNPVELNFAEAVLKNAGIKTVEFDTHMSIMDGSMVIIPRRLMVADADEARAQLLLREALSSRSEWT